LARIIENFEIGKERKSLFFLIFIPEKIPIIITKKIIIPEEKNIPYLGIFVKLSIPLPKIRKANNIPKSQIG